MDKDSEKLGAWVPMLFPCIGLVETESSWSVFQIIPISVNKTQVIIRSKVKNTSTMSFLKQATQSYRYWQTKSKGKYPNSTQDHPLTSGDVMQEDKFVCEQMQKSLTSPYFEFGPSALHGEQPVRAFQKIIKSKLGL